MLKRSRVVSSTPDCLPALWCLKVFHSSLWLFTLSLYSEQEHFGKDKSKDFQLFSSPHGKNLLFKDSAQGFLKVPPRMDSNLYLGYEYVTAVRNLRDGICKCRGRSLDSGLGRARTSDAVFPGAFSNAAFSTW